MSPESASVLDKFIYAPLAYPDEFRLLNLHPKTAADSQEEPFLIELVAARLDQNHFYSALSYAWGDDSDRVAIGVVDGTSVRTIRITKNLQRALLQLRSSQQKVLWVDAVCINQNDTTEKNRQVRRMAEIYRKAHEVLIWLGEAADDSDRAIEFMKRMSVSNIGDLVVDKGLVQSWRALATLVRRPWFTRRWIIQEVAYAETALLCCGTYQIPWTQFCEAVALFTRKADLVYHLFRACEKDQTGWGATLRTRASTLGKIAREFSSVMFPFSYVSPRREFFFPGIAIESQASWDDQCLIVEVQEGAVHSLIANLGRIMRKEQSGNQPRRLCDMNALLQYLPAFEASEPRDVVFAASSLAKDSHGILPDYRQSVVRVYKNAIHQAIRDSGSLNIICRPWAHTSEKLPSWIPQLHKLPITRCQATQKYLRLHADNLVCLPHERRYRASGTIRAFASFNDDEENFVLEVKGVQLPEITWLGHPAWNGILPGSWFDSLAKSNVNMFWQTLVADRDLRGDNVPLWYRRAFHEAYESSQGGVLNTIELLRRLEEKYKQGLASTEMIEFLRRVQAVTWNRRFVILEDDSLGLVPEQTDKQDRICILFGCDVPVVLRRRDGGFWELIGEAFVHGSGVMDGEAMERPFEKMNFSLF